MKAVPNNDRFYFYGEIKMVISLMGIRKVLFMLLWLLIVPTASWATSKLDVDSVAEMSEAERTALFQAGLTRSDTNINKLQNQFFWRLNVKSGEIVSTVQVKTVAGKLIASTNKAMEEGNCYLVLLDTSGSMKKYWRDAQAALMAWIALLPVTSVYGVYGFAEDFSEIKSVNSDMDIETLSTILGDLKLTGKDTQLYLAISKAIEKAAICPAARKHLVVLSDGDAEDKAHNLQEVSALASTQKISVHTIGFGNLAKSKTALKLEILKTVSNKTQGEYQHFDDVDSLKSAISTLLDNHHQMGVVEVELSTVPYGESELVLYIEAEDPTGHLHSWQQPLFVSDTKKRENLLAFISELAGGKDPKVIVLAVGSLLLFLFIALILLRRNKKQHLAEIKKQKAEELLQQKQQNLDMQDAIDLMHDKIDAFAPQDPVNEQGTPYGWLKDTQSGQYYDLIKYSSLIGRLLENDIVLNHPQISNEHAILDFKKGEFIWTDRAPLNPTIINGESVAGSRKIMPHDIVICGGLTLEFILA